MQPPTLETQHNEESAFDLHFGETLNSMIIGGHPDRTQTNDESFHLTFDFLLPSSNDFLHSETLTFVTQPTRKDEAPCTITSSFSEQPTCTSVVPLSEGQKYVDITDFLCLPQTQAAKMIGVPTSTLSKRWKEAAQGKKWPYRTLRKLDKEITMLMQNVNKHGKSEGNNTIALTPDLEAALGFLLRRRQIALSPVVIRV